MKVVNLISVSIELINLLLHCIYEPFEVASIVFYLFIAWLLLEISCLFDSTLNIESKLVPCLRVFQISTIHFVSVLCLLEIRKLDSQRNAFKSTIWQLKLVDFALHVLNSFVEPFIRSASATEPGTNNFFGSSVFHMLYQILREIFDFI